MERLGATEFSRPVHSPAPTKSGLPRKAPSHSVPTSHPQMMSQHAR